jgi:predicted TIM-barrel fold metal-dependent hydrolase
MPETRFESVYDLARLPYFEIRDGRLVLADASLGPIIDAHAHLAMAFVLPLQVDLLRETPETEHYLPMERRLDLDVYINRNFTEGDLRRLKRDLTFASLTGKGLRATHTIPNLLRDMRGLAVAASVLLPIDYPVLSQNATATLTAARGRSDLIVFGSVHPFARDLAGKLDAQVALGAKGIKVHPNVQMVPPENARAMRLYRLCGERKLPVFFHCGPVGIEPWLGRRLTQVRRYERPIAENPETVFILGHSGSLQMDEAIALAQRYPNVYLELASQSLGNVRRLLEAVPEERILFGTDWPWYHQAIGLAKVLIATVGPSELSRKVLYANAARLFGRE